jgi:exopolysaccharide biosynthesis polyprenyl glycosylphosphotransferase
MTPTAQQSTRPFDVAGAPQRAKGELRFGGAVSARYRPRDYLTRRLLLLADAIGLVLAFAGMLAVSPVDRPLESILLGLLSIPVWLVLFKAYGLYDRDIKRISHSTVDDLPWLLHALLVGCLLTWTYYKFLPGRRLVLFDILALAAFSLLAIVALRSGVRRVVTHALSRERVLFIGDGEATELLAGKMRAHPEYGLEPIGAVSAAALGATEESPASDQLDARDLEDLLTRFKPDRVVICPSSVDETALLELMHVCKERSLKVSVLPRLFGAMGPSLEVDDVEGVTVLGINPPVLPRSSRLMKRSLDFAGSALALLLTAPLMLLIAIAVKLDSRGPIFFKQRRIGRAERPFQLVKFRTMSIGAEQQAEELLSQTRDPGWLKLDNDPRVTRVGRLLRLTSLDELPELWNVLKGQMSLVGPRPLIETEDRQIGGWARSRLDLTPGITGLWQVLGRTNIPFEEMIKLDYLYVTNWTLWTDIRLIIKTLPAVLTRRGAN